MAFSKDDREMLKTVHHHSKTDREDFAQAQSHHTAATQFFGDLGGFLGLGGGGGGKGIEKAVHNALKRFFQDTFKEIEGVLNTALVDFVSHATDTDEIQEQIAELCKRLSKHKSIHSAFESLSRELSAFYTKTIEETTVDLSAQLVAFGARNTQEILRRSKEGWNTFAKEFPNTLRELHEVPLAFCKRFFACIGDRISHDSLPFALQHGPRDAFNAIANLRHFLDIVEPGPLENGEPLPHPDVTIRLKAVSSSLKALSKIITGKDSGESEFLFGLLVDKGEKAFRDLYEGKLDSKEAVVKLMTSIMDPGPLIEEIIKRMAKGQFWLWANLPDGLPLGALNAWLNDIATYDSDDKYLEREYRARLAGNIDAYVRSEFDSLNTRSPLVRFDEQASTSIIAGIICVFVDTTILFLLEPDCYPHSEAEWDNYEDRGLHLSQFVSRQVRGAIRGVIGTLLRGVWWFSVGNENLVEAIGTIAGSIFSALVEGALRNVLYRVEVLTAYAGTKEQAEDAGFYVFHKWESLETYTSHDGTEERLTYLAFIRGHRTNASMGALLESYKNNRERSEYILRAIEDVGAYLDVSYQRMRIENNKVDTPNVDVVTITRAEISRGVLIVWASTSARYEVVRPVLRMYCGCSEEVMTPGSSAADAYSCSIQLSRLTPEKIVVVKVQSSWGGESRRQVRHVS